MVTISKEARARYKLIAKYSDSEWGQLKFDWHKLPYSDILEQFKVLSVYKEFKNLKISERSYVFRYILLLYDKDSFLRERFDSVPKMKYEAAILAGFMLKNGKFTPFVQDMLINKIREVNSAIIRFLLMQNTPKWAKLATFQESYEQQLKNLINDTATKSEKTGEILKNVNVLEEQISTLLNEMTNGDTNQNLIDALYEEITVQSLGLRPEDIADKFRDGEDPLMGYSPYILEHELKDA